LAESAQHPERLAPGAWKIIAVAVLGSFLAQLDATVVNVSLSTLATELHTGLSTIQWVTSGYLLALALMLPLTGWLVERIGAKRLYLLCFTTFTLSSALCALSWSAGSLIGFRVLQGLSGGLMAPMAQLMVARAAGRQIVRVVGYASLPILLGPILGPVIAGAILQHASWHWLFLINLPIGALAVLLAWLFLPDEHELSKATRDFDLVGFLLLSPGLVLLLYGSDHLKEGTGIAAMTCGAALLAVFIRRALRDRERALIDLQLFRIRSFSRSAVTQFTVNGLGFAGQMLIPAYLIRDAGLSQSMTGWLMAPQGLGMMATFPVLDRMTKRFGTRGTAAAGAILALLGTLALLWLSAKFFSPAVLAGALFVRGAGMGMVMMSSISVAYTSVKKAELPMATTSLNIVQRLGGPVLTTACATFLGWRLAAEPTIAGVGRAFTMSFALLCALQTLLVLVAAQLHVTIEKANEQANAQLQAELSPES
jgi:EmrB/QacA subfamily drug resistance transporter